MSQAALLEALREAVQPDPGASDAVTAGELAEATGWHILRVREHLVRMRKAGEVEVVRVRREGLDGRNALVPAYRLLRER